MHIDDDDDTKSKRNERRENKNREKWFECDLNRRTAYFDYRLFNWFFFILVDVAVVVEQRGRYAEQ